MAGYQHPLERRSNLLASALTRRVTTFSDALRPPGSRPPFTQTFGRTRALDTILKYYHLPQTQQWLGAMDPQSRLELQVALGQHIRDQGLVQPRDAATMDQAQPMAANPLAAPDFRATGTG